MASSACTLARVAAESFLVGSFLIHANELNKASLLFPKTSRREQGNPRLPFTKSSHPSECRQTRFETDLVLCSEMTYTPSSVEIAHSLENFWGTVSLSIYPNSVK